MQESHFPTLANINSTVQGKQGGIERERETSRGRRCDVGDVQVKEGMGSRSY
jgi:hypothetical protein